jgi:hypothetical protein
MNPTRRMQPRPSHLYRSRAIHWLGEQVRARLGKPDVGSRAVQRQPATVDRQLERGAVFVGTALKLKQKRPVDLLDIDATVLNGIDRVGDLDQLAGCFFP